MESPQRSEENRPCRPTGRGPYSPTGCAAANRSCQVSSTVSNQHQPANSRAIAVLATAGRLRRTSNPTHPRLTDRFRMTSSVSSSR